MPTRARLFSGAVIGALCVLPFYQGLWTACAKAGLSLRLYPAGGLPLIILLCLIGAVAGGGYALAMARWNIPGWRSGALLGLLMTLFLWFVVSPLRGLPIAGDWQVVRMTQTLTIHIAWGVCVGISLKLLLAWVAARPREPATAQPG
jgi:uncharacterized protein (DUF983 family)